MQQLPGGAVEYKRTAEFDERSVPAGLLRRHSLKAGTWGEIVVTAGRVLYVLEDEALQIDLDVDHPGVVMPQVPHHVVLEPGARFFVRFLRL